MGDHIKIVGGTRHVGETGMVVKVGTGADDEAEGSEKQKAKRGLNSATMLTIFRCTPPSNPNPSPSPSPNPEPRTPNPNPEPRTPNPSPTRALTLTLTLTSDMTESEIQVSAAFVQECAEVSQGLETLGAYSLHDLVMLDRTSVGCIVKVQHSPLKRTLSPSPNPGPDPHPNPHPNP